MIVQMDEYCYGVIILSVNLDTFDFGELDASKMMRITGCK